jgi:hypothetical protein
MASRGLSTMDLDGIRSTLESGRKPRVVFTPEAGQIAGQAGHVVALRDPADDEWVVVQFGRDELPFAPTDLAMPRRQSATRAPTDRPARDGAGRRPTVSARAPADGAASAIGTDPGTVRPAAADTVDDAKPDLATPHLATPDRSVLDGATRHRTSRKRSALSGTARPRTIAPDIPPQRQEAPMPGSKTSTAAAATANGRAPANGAAPTGAANGAAHNGTAPTSTAPNGVPAGPTGQNDGAPRARTPRPAKVKAAPTLTVTLSYTDGDWFVGAQQGSKALARPYVINASEALRMVALLDVPGVQEAVGHIIDAERADANKHADRLRAELAAVEARLAALPTV